MPVHMVYDDERFDWDADLTEVRAVCGTSALIGPDAVPMPSDFDFVVWPDARALCDCRACLSTPIAAYIERELSKIGACFVALALALGLTACALPIRGADALKRLPPVRVELAGSSSTAIALGVAQHRCGHLLFMQGRSADPRTLRYLGSVPPARDCRVVATSTTGQVIECEVGP